MRYHVVRVNDKTGFKVYMTGEPVTHAEACTLKSKLNPLERFPHVRTILEPNP